MFNQTIKKRVMEVMSRRIQNAQDKYDEKVEELSNIHEEKVLEMEENLEREKLKLADELVETILGAAK